MISSEVYPHLGKCMDDIIGALPTIWEAHGWFCKKNTFNTKTQTTKPEALDLSPDFLLFGDMSGRMTAVGKELFRKV